MEKMKNLFVFLIPFGYFVSHFIDSLFCCLVKALMVKENGQKVVQHQE